MPSLGNEPGFLVLMAGVLPTRLTFHTAIQPKLSVSFYIVIAMAYLLKDASSTN